MDKASNASRAGTRDHSLAPIDAAPSAAFTLDTSGAVLTGNRIPHPTSGVAFEWSDLTPFCQGFIRAMKEAHYGLQLHPAMKPEDDPDGDISLDWTFSDLSPAALERIVRECESFRGRTQGAALGALFWKNRQGGHWSQDGFGPLLVSLDREGKVIVEDQP